MARQSPAERLESAAAHYERVTSAAFERIAAAAAAFAKAETLAYSRAHPRRTVTFCAAMGTTTLHVTPGGTNAFQGDYQFSAQSSYSRHKPPAFLVTLEEADETADGKGWLAGPLRFVCKGGKVIADDSDW